MRNFRFFNSIRLFVAVAALSSTSCSSGPVTNDKLVIGMECAYQPFNWTVNKASEFTLPIDGTNQFADGYDISVAKYLSEDLGKEVVIKKLEWDSLIVSLQNGDINMILAGMSDTPKRRESIDFTVPYLSSDLAFLVKTENLPAGNSKDNPLSYEALLTLFSGKNLVCQSSVVGDEFIDTYFVSQEGYNIHHNQPQATYPLAAQDVKAGIAFAMPAELPVVEAMTNLGGLSVLYCDYRSFISTEDLGGLSVSIGTKKGNTEFTNELNTSLNKLTEAQRSKMMGEASQRSADNA